MIISHRHQFIFVKTRKTAGTSVEIALARHCHKGDVVTPFATGESPDMRRAHGAMGPTGYFKPFSQYGARDWLRLVGRQRRIVRFSEHTPARDARRYLGTQWDRYLTFGITRNPWDRVVSAYYWHLHRRKLEMSFSDYLDWVLIDRPLTLTNWPLIGAGQQLLVDRVLRYENLGEELSALSHETGLNISLPDERFKGDVRRARAYREVMTEAEAQLIGRICHREIEVFCYSF